MQKSIDTHATDIIVKAYDVDSSTALDTWMMIGRAAKVFLNMYVKHYTQQDVDAVVKNTLSQMETEGDMKSRAKKDNARLISVQAHIVTVVRDETLRHSRNISDEDCRG